jgi:hypothetical protein
MVSIWARHDDMVAPQESSQLACAESVPLAGVGHNALLGDRRVLDRVALEVRSAGAG